MTWYKFITNITEEEKQELKSHISKKYGVVLIRKEIIVMTKDGD